MAAEKTSNEPEEDDKTPAHRQNGADGGQTASSAQEEDEDEEEEPRLKYASLTKSLSPLYRNGDASSAFIVAGDKMVCGLGSYIARDENTDMRARSLERITATL